MIFNSNIAQYFQKYVIDNETLVNISYFKTLKKTIDSNWVVLIIIGHTVNI